MECVVCGEPVAVADTSCPACGALVAPLTDHGTTQVSAARRTDTAGGPPRGEVLAERYEIEERIAADAVCARYRAIDQESEQRVVLAVVRPELVPSQRDRDALLDRLRAAAGVGGRYLPGLLDADREGAQVFAVEPLSHGAALRDVLDARRARGEAMAPAEVLPVAAQLAAALAGIAPPLHHGDVRAERVVIDRDGLRLTGAFLLPALPPSAVARALAADDGARRWCAPEVLRGAPSGDAADRYGVAAIVLEALTGRGPDSGRDAAPPAFGHPRVDEALRELLAPDPASRAASLDALVEAIAEVAGLPVPDLDPAPFRRLRRPSSQRLPRPADPRASEDGPRAAGASALAPRVGAGDVDAPPYLADAATDVMRPAAVAGVAPLPPAYRAGARAPDRPPHAGDGPTLADPEGPAFGAALEPPTDADTTQRQPALDAAALDHVASALGAGASGPAADVAGAAARPAVTGSAAARPAVTGPAAASPARRADVGDLDPRLVRAALGVTLADDGEEEPVTTHHLAGTRPLVDGARLPGADATAATGAPPRRPGSKPRTPGATEQLTADDLAELAVEAHARRAARADAAPVRAQANGAQAAIPRHDVQRARTAVPARAAASPATLPIPASRPAPAAPGPRSAPAPAPAPALAPAPASAPAASERFPRPAPDPSVPRGPTPPLPQAAPLPSPVATPASAAPASSARAAAPAAGAGLGRALADPVGVSTERGVRDAPRPLRVDAQDLAATRSASPARGGLVIGAAVLIALLIVAGGAFIVWKRQSDSARERERLLEQRFERLRQGG